MNSLNKGVIIALGLILFGGISLLTYQTVEAQGNTGKPPVVVTVNLASVLERLDQRANAEVMLKEITDTMVAEDDVKKAELEGLQSELESISDPQKRQAHQEKMALATLRYQAWVRFSSEKVDVERSLLLQDLYRTIQTAAAQMAETSGYDIVLVNDSAGQLTTNPDSRVSRELQTRQQITGRRMLFSKPHVDITDELVTWMNNAFKAAG